MLSHSALQLTKARDEMKSITDEQGRNVESLQHTLEAERSTHAAMMKQLEYVVSCCIGLL